MQDTTSAPQPAVWWYTPWVLAEKVKWPHATEREVGACQCEARSNPRSSQSLAGLMHSAHSLCCKAGHEGMWDSPEAATGASSSTGSARPSSLARYILVTDASATALAYHREPTQAHWSGAKGMSHCCQLCQASQASLMGAEWTPSRHHRSTDKAAGKVPIGSSMQRPVGPYRLASISTPQSVRPGSDSATQQKFYQSAAAYRSRSRLRQPGWR